MLAVFLESHGYEVRVVHDGPAAVREAATFLPEVVLLDLSMPHVSGLDVCRQVRQQPWGQSMRIIALTGWTGERHRRESAEAGFDAFVMKPVEPAALLDLLRSR